MEKFSIKWHDFQTTVSQSFGLLRQEEDFFDVTLVSDDELEIPAHKLVLAASSSFFKSLLRKGSHPHPLLYLSGVNSTNLGFIIDYIYHGEIQICQEQLDSFLIVARKLKVSGLNSDDNEEADSDPQKISPNNDQKNIDAQSKNKIAPPPVSLVKSKKNKNNFVLKTEDEYEKSENISIDDEDMKNETKDSSPTDSLEPSEIQSRISEMLQKSDGLSTCKICGKFGKDASNMRRHAETHIDGIVYPCTICERTFKSKNSFRVHKYSTHTTI